MNINRRRATLGQRRNEFDVLEKESLLFRPRFRPTLLAIKKCCGFQPIVKLHRFAIVAEKLEEEFARERTACGIALNPAANSPVRKPHRRDALIDAGMIRMRHRAAGSPYFG